jgi:hypothetical protein
MSGQPDYNLIYFILSTTKTRRVNPIFSAEADLPSARSRTNLLDVFIQELSMEIIAQGIVNKSLLMLNFSFCLVFEYGVFVPPKKRSGLE